MDITDGEKFFSTLRFLGLENTGHSGNERICTCPACGKEDHFYWNVAKNVGTCQRCSISYAPHLLLETLLDLLPAEDSGQALQALANDRQLPLAALKDCDFTFWQGWYLLPFFGQRGELESIRRYKFGAKILWCAGCPSEMWGVHRLSDASRLSEAVYICEGEWDAIALEWLRTQSNQPGVVIAVPGAGVFKPQWCRHFANRSVSLLFDKDLAGDNGMKKTADQLVRVGAVVKCVHWPSEFRSGFDVRDFFISRLRSKCDA